MFGHFHPHHSLVRPRCPCRLWHWLHLSLLQRPVAIECVVPLKMEFSKISIEFGKRSNFISNPNVHTYQQQRHPHLDRLSLVWIHLEMKHKQKWFEFRQNKSVRFDRISSIPFSCVPALPMSRSASVT